MKRDETWPTGLCQQNIALVIAQLYLAIFKGPKNLCFIMMASDEAVLVVIIAGDKNFTT